MKEMKLAEQQIRNIDRAAQRQEYLTYANNSTLDLKGVEQQTFPEFEPWEFYRKKNMQYLSRMKAYRFLSD